MAITKRACVALACGVGCVAVPASSSVGALHIDSQERIIRVDAGTGGTTNSTIVHTNTDVGFFQDSIAVTQDVGFGLTNRAHATQMSMIAPTYFWMVGEVGGADNYPWGGSGYGTASNSLRVTCTSDEPIPLAISWQSPVGGSSWGALVRVTGVTNSTEFDIYSEWNNPYEGVLPAGTYIILAQFSDGGNGAGASGGRSHHSLMITVPTVSTGTMMLMPLVVAGRRRRR